MKAFVFTDEALKEHAGRFVWLAVDTEKEQNAAVQAKHPIDAWPTLLIVDPADERVALRWVGAATVPQLLRLLDEGRVAVAGGTSAGGVEAALALAERHYGAREFPAAVKAYQEALALAPADWPRYGRTVESLLFALNRTSDCATAITVARAALPRVGPATPSGLNVAASGLDCALQAPATDPARAETIAFFETAAREIVRNPKLEVAADDRSGLYGVLVQAR